MDGFGLLFLDEGLAKETFSVKFRLRTLSQDPIMKTNPALIAFAALAAAGALLAAPPSAKVESPVEVTFVSPENFTDLRDEWMATDRGREDYMALLKEHLEKRAPMYLAAGQKLAISILDVDMAGDFEPWRGAQFSSVRIVKDMYPPRIKFTFKLTDAEGKVVKEGERNIRDDGFMFAPKGFSSDTLRYEYNLLDDWLRSEFPRAKK